MLLVPPMCRRNFPGNPGSQRTRNRAFVSFVRCFIRRLLVRLEPAALLRRGGEMGDFFLFLFSGNRQIPGLATGAVGHSLFYSRR